MVLGVDFTSKFIRNAKPDQEEAISKLLNDHIEALMYNVASIAAVTALVQDKKKIESKHIGFVRAYISEECTASSGRGGGEQRGGSLPSEYFGYSTGAYSPNNAGGIDMSDAHFGDGGYIRPALNTMLGAGQVIRVTRDNATAKRFVKAILKFNDVAISKNAFDELLHIVDIHINCLMNDINKQSTSNNSHTTLLKVEKALELKRHSVFK